MNNTLNKVEYKSIKDFTYEEFWKQFDQEKYEYIRKKYHAKGNFMDIYEKINYRNEVQKNNIRSQLFMFFGKKYLKQINNNKEKLIR